MCDIPVTNTLTYDGGSLNEQHRLNKLLKITFYVDLQLVVEEGLETSAKVS